MVNLPLPESLDKECLKAAKTLRSFTMPETAGGIDSMIPPSIIDQSRGLVILTVVKAGFLFSGRVGFGLVVAKLPNGSWSAPSAIGTGSFGAGLQIGAELTDFVIVLNNQRAVESFSYGGNVALGGNLSVAAGPVGRNAEAAAMATIAATYSYSKTRGLFAGISLEGTVFAERADANEKMYGKKVKPRDLLCGTIPPPPEAAALYEAIRAHEASRKMGNVTYLPPSHPGDLGYHEQLTHPAAPAVQSYQSPPDGYPSTSSTFPSSSAFPSSSSSAPPPYLPSTSISSTNFPPSPPFLAPAAVATSVPPSTFPSTNVPSTFPSSSTFSSSSSSSHPSEFPPSSLNSLPPSYPSDLSSSSYPPSTSFSPSSPSSFSPPYPSSFSSFSPPPAPPPPPVYIPSYQSSFKSSFPSSYPSSSSKSSSFPSTYPSSAQPSSSTFSSSPPYPPSSSSFPSSSSSSSSSSSPHSSTVTTSPPSPPKKIKTFAFETVHHHRHHAPETIVTTYTVPASSAAPPPLPSRHSTFGRALYDYQAQREGDLSFRAGEMIQITEKTNSSQDWWRGRIAGREGAFPANYVQIS